MTDRQRVLDIPPHRIVINVEREYLPGQPDPNGGFFAGVLIERLDGQPVYKNFLTYQIGDGEIFKTLEEAKQDASNRARDAITNGFPET